MSLQKFLISLILNSARATCYSKLMTRALFFLRGEMGFVSSSKIIFSLVSIFFISWGCHTGFFQQFDCSPGHSSICEFKLRISTWRDNFRINFWSCYILLTNITRDCRIDHRVRELTQFTFFTMFYLSHRTKTFLQWIQQFICYFDSICYYIRDGV